MKQETLSSFEAAKAYHLEAAEALQRAIDASALVESIATKEKAAAQLDDHIEDLTRAVARKQDELAAIDAAIDDRAAKLAAFEASHGKTIRLQDLDAKIAAREADLRRANSRWQEFLKDTHIQD